MESLAAANFPWRGGNALSSALYLESFHAIPAPCGDPRHRPSRSRLSGCGYNTIPTLEEQAKAKWADVQNQYQRRADLIPNLVATVKGYAKQEKDVLTSVIEARAKATSVHLDASQLTDPRR